MISFKDFVTELFDTKEAQSLEWDWDSASVGYKTSFEIDSIKYEILVSEFWDIAWSPEEIDFPQFTDKQWESLHKGTWHLEFYQTENDNSEHGITGKMGFGSPKVFGIVGNAVIDLLKRYPNVFKNLYFRGKEPSRIKLYQRIAPVLARQLNKKLFINSKGDGFFLVSPLVPHQREPSL